VLHRSREVRGIVRTPRHDPQVELLFGRVDLEQGVG
jgi:hypothetical protein